MNENESKMAEMHIHGGVSAIFHEVSLPWIKILSWQIKFFEHPHNHHGHIFHLHAIQGHASSQAYHSHNTCGTSTCDLFTLGSKWSSCYATHVTDTPFLPGHHPVSPRKQVQILSCNPHNLCGMSKESSCRYPTLLGILLGQFCATLRWKMLVLSLCS